MKPASKDPRPVRLKTPAGQAVFGPVPSRRLGLSLGVDLLWPKSCTLDCRYCECGPTDNLTTQRQVFRDAQDVLREVKERLAELDPAPDYITLAGSGEPTLHEDFGWVIQELKKLGPKVAVLTNATLLDDPQVRAELAQADLVVPSLDAVSPRAFRRVNRPAPGLDPEKIIQSLVEFKKQYSGKLWLEILLVEGVNDSQEELDALIQAAERIAPDKVQLNTVIRPPADGTCRPVSRERLDAFAARFSMPCEVSSPPQRKAQVDQGRLGDEIVEMTRRRPLELEDVARAVGIGPKEAEALIAELSQAGRLVEQRFGERIFYRGRE
jgi:wyosine [tRNA(Phe)-imidazoG37] synthetase (radical SAM superfamily)